MLQVAIQPAPNPYITKNWALMGYVIVDWSSVLIKFCWRPLLFFLSGSIFIIGHI